MKTDTVEERSAQVRFEQQRNQRMTSEKWLLKYLWQSIRQNSLWMLLQRWLEWFRRFRLVSLIIRIGSLLWGILQTGATVLLSTLLLLVALPLLLSWLLGILLTALLETKRSNRRLWALTEGKTVYVLFLPRTESAFFAANARDLSRRKDSVVIAVSPYWLSSRGLRRGYFYCTLRKEEDALYLVRPFYFFPLTRRVLIYRKTAYLY